MALLLHTCLAVLLPLLGRIRCQEILASKPLKCTQIRSVSMLRLHQQTVRALVVAPHTPDGATAPTPFPVRTQ